MATVIHFVPKHRVVVQRARVEGNSRAGEHVRDFRDRAGGTMHAPSAGHGRAVTHFVERRVINRRCGLEVQDNDGNFGALHHRQNRGRKRVSRDVKKNQIHVLLPEAMSGFKGLERRINQAEIHHLDSGSFELVADDPDITFEALFESFELRPVGV